MSEYTEPDPTDPGTLRPNVPPIESRGDEFVPMKCPDFDLEITLPDHVSPDDPITLYTLYYTPEIINQIVLYTNNVPRQPQDRTRPNARASTWYPTSCPEVYIFLGIRIYMTLFAMDDVADYWSTHSLFPKHPITQYMTRDRWQELHMRYKVAPVGHQTLWDRVCYFCPRLLLDMENKY
jgi:hypothetical protein